MQSASLESGILKVFRFFLSVQLLLLFVSVLAHGKHSYLEGNPWLILLAGGSSSALLLGYLSWPWLQRKLGRFYLPLALVLSALFSLVLQDIFLDIRFTAAEGSREETAWTLFLFLFIPLVLVSWQYDFKAVVAYTVFTLVCDYALMRYGRADFHQFAGTYGRLLLVRAISFLIAGYVIAGIMHRFRQQRGALQRANRDLAHYAATLEQLTISRERNRMARELHDTLAHTLSGIAVQLEAAESLWPLDAAEARAMLAKSLAATRTGLAETRRALQALRASPLEDMGLPLALRTLAEGAAERAGFQLDMAFPDPAPKLAPDVAQGVYRIVQEALENVVRHAGATRVDVRWDVAGSRLAFSVRDNGCGFFLSEQVSGQHFGLRGMKERAGMMGADLTVISHAGQGTAVRLSLEV
ncbi:MAG: sensor histidine kinase [Chloroflexota bacterium]